MHIGHVGYIAGLIVISLMGIFILSSSVVNFLFEEKSDNPDRSRKIWGIVILSFSMVALLFLMFNWDRVSPAGRIIF